MNTIRVKFEFDSSVRFDNSSDDGIAKYTLLKDDVEYDEEFVLELRLSFPEANRLARMFEMIIMLSREDGHAALMQKFERFIDSEYTL